MKYQQQYVDKPMDIPMDISSNKNAVHWISSIHPNLKKIARRSEESESMPKDWGQIRRELSIEKHIAKTPVRGVRGVLQFGLAFGYLT